MKPFFKYLKSNKQSYKPKKHVLIRVDKTDIFIIPEEAVKNKWIAMHEIDKTQQSVKFDNLREESIEQLEAQLDGRTLKMACLKFSGEPGFSPHEKERLRLAMIELVYNSTRTVIACVLDKIQLSDGHNKIKDYFISEDKTPPGILATLLVNQLHNLVTDPTQIIEFVNNQNPSAVMKKFQKQDRETLRETFASRGLHLRSSHFAIMQGRDRVGSFDERGWSNILADDDNYDSNQDNSTTFTRYAKHEYKNVPITPRNAAAAVSVDSNMLHFGRNSAQRAYLIYQSIITSVARNASSAHLLYKCVLDEYKSTIQ